jgi:hypothetical protein
MDLRKSARSRSTAVRGSMPHQQVSPNRTYRLGIVARQGLETSLLQRLDISMFVRGDRQNRGGQS